MTKKIIPFLFLIASLAQASIQEIIPKLSSKDLAVQTKAQAELLTACSHAGRPGADAERKAICLEICNVLKKGCSNTVATQLIRNLQRIGGEESVVTLAKMLNNPNQHLRGEVRQALAVNPSPLAGKALRTALKKSRDSRWTAGLIIALGERGELGTSAVIAPYLKKNDPRVFTAAAKALSQLNEPVGIKAIAQLRNRKKGSEKAVLTAALFETDRKEVFERLYDKSESDDVRAVALMGMILSRNTTVAAEAWGSENPLFQSAVIEAASQHKTEAVYTIIAQGIGDLPPYLQIQTLGVLELSGSTIYSQVIVPLLESENEEVQVAAAQALSKVGAAEAVPALITCGSKEAITALGLINAPDADKMISKEAAEGGDETRRAVAIEALVLRGNVQLMDQYFIDANDPSTTISKAGIRAIQDLGRDEDIEKAVALLLAKENSRESRDVLKAIVAILRRSEQPEVAVSALVVGMAAASDKGQALIMQVLTQSGSKEALAPVAKAAHSDNPVLRKTALKQLSNWPNDNSLPVLMELAGDASSPLAEHVLAVRGVKSRLAAQKKLNKDVARQAMELCRREEDRKQFADLISATEK